MSRCGCNDTCTCKVDAGVGVDVSGVGTANNPYKIRFDPRSGSIMGPGLAWSEQDKELSTLISSDADNGITIGTDDGLYASTSGDSGGGDTGGASVGNLPKEGIVGGMCGAGYMHVPQCLVRSYQRALALGLDMVHVPVRTLRDGTTVVLANNDLDAITNGESSNKPAEMDTQAWSNIDLVTSRYDKLGKDDPDIDDVTGLPSKMNWYHGSFGFGERPQRSGTFCSDVAHHVGGRIVIVWQVHDQEASTDLRRILKRWRLQGSSIVASTDLDLLEPYHSMGVAVGGIVEKEAHLDSVSPTAISDAGGKWAFLDMDAGFSRDDMVKYPGADLNTVGLRAQYQSEQERITSSTDDDGGLGFRGALSTDPVYYNGVNNDHVYRHDQSTWQQNTVEYGQFNDSRVVGLFGKPLCRGYVHQGANSMFLAEDASWAKNADKDGQECGPWWIQQGWMCPIPTDGDGSYTIGFWVRWRNTVGSGLSNRVCLAFGVENDHKLRTGSKDGFKDPGKNGCYVAKFDFGGASAFEDWSEDGSKETYDMKNQHDIPEHFPTEPMGEDNDLEQNKVESAFTITVDRDAGKIRVLQGDVDRDTGMLKKEHEMVAHDEVVHTGRYVYVGNECHNDMSTEDRKMRTAFRHLDVKAGVQQMWDMWPWTKP